MSADSDNLDDRKKKRESGLHIEGEPEIIRNEITKRLVDLPEMKASDVVIHVNDDQVELHGWLPSQQRLRLMEIIQAVQGVEHVHWNADLPHAKNVSGNVQGGALYNYGGTHGPGEGPDDDTDLTHGEGEGPDDIA